MAIYVLVHGGWHGGWCWKWVVLLLRQAGAETFAPTLTGLGERAHLAHPAVGLDTHVQDVVNVLEYEDLRDVVLVGHSSGAMVIPAVADRAPDRVAHLVYFDTFVPRDGEAWLDLLPPERRDALVELARTAREGWRVPAPPATFFGVTEEADLAWVQPRLLPQPLQTFADPLRLRHPGVSPPSELTSPAPSSPTSGASPSASAPMRPGGTGNWRQVMTRW